MCEDMNEDEFILRLELQEVNLVKDRWRERITELENENKLLKQQLTEWALNMARDHHSMHEKERSDKTRRWKFYHEHKSLIKEELGKDVHWRVIKKHTDDLYLQKEKRTE